MDLAMINFIPGMLLHCWSEAEKASYFFLIYFIFFCLLMTKWICFTIKDLILDIESDLLNSVWILTMSKHICR